MFKFTEQGSDRARLEPRSVSNAIVFFLHPLLGYVHYSESGLLMEEPCPETFLGTLAPLHSALDHFMLSPDHLLLYAFHVVYDVIRSVALELSFQDLACTSPVCS